MLKRKRKSIDFSNFRKLDPWVSPPLNNMEDTVREREIYKACVFIDLPEILEYFKTQEKVLDYEKLMNLLRKQYGHNLNAFIYLGAFPKGDISAQDFKRQSRFFEELSDIGYNLIKSDLFVRDNGKIVLKGLDVSLGIDMIQYFHPKISEFNLAVLFCGNSKKFRKPLQIIKQKFDRKIKIISLSQKYEENLDDFKDFVNSISKNSLTNSQWSFYPNLRTYKRMRSDSVKMFTVSKTNQERLREKSRKLRERKTLNNRNDKKTALFIDYGNLHHSFLNIKRACGKYRNFCEIDLLMLLKSKVESHNHLEKAKIFMGIPLLNIKDLEAMRKDKEKLYESLKQCGFEVYFSYNEVLFEGGMKESDIDLRIAIDIAYSVLECNFEKYVLVSGDADFIPVVRMLKKFGKDVEIWTFTEDSLSPFLIEEINDPTNAKVKCIIKSITEMIN